MVSHGEHGSAMVRIGNGSAPAMHDHYQLLPPRPTTNYSHEANRLCRVIHPGHSRIMYHSELAVPYILLEPTVGYNVARSRCPES